MAKSCYDYTCADCKQPKQVSYKPKLDQLCQPCSARLMAAKMQGKNTKANGTHKRYWYFCPTCPSVRASISKKKTAYCGACSRKHSRTIPKESSVRYFRICPECPLESNTKQVKSQANGGIKLCGSCVKKGNGHSGGRLKGSKNKKGTKPRRKEYTPIGVDGLQKVNIRTPKPKYQIVDLDTMEAPVKKREPKEFPQSTPEEDAIMIAKFLKDKYGHQEN